MLKPADAEESEDAETPQILPEKAFALGARIKTRRRLATALRAIVEPGVGLRLDLAPHPMHSVRELN
jgi:hypothetical protein